MISKLLEKAWIYRLWARLMSSDKIKVIKKEIKYINFKTVADLGCGPAINTWLFQGKDYIGIDFNPRYIEYSRKKHPSATFLVADVSRDNLKLPFKPDLFLLNSLLHHVSDEEAHLILRNVKNHLSNNGRVLIIDNILPSRRERVKNWFARHDRGKFVRIYERWKKLFGQHFDIEKTYIFKAKLVYLFRVWELCLFILEKTDKKSRQG